MEADATSLERSWVLHVDLDQFLAAVEILRRPELAGLPVVVEQLGWDEAFVGVRTADPEAFASLLQDRVRTETGLSCAVGIGETKLQAKTATGFGKPGGVARLTRAAWPEVMGERPVTAIWGIGPRTSLGLADPRHPERRERDAPPPARWACPRAIGPRPLP